MTLSENSTHLVLDKKTLPAGITDVFLQAVADSLVSGNDIALPRKIEVSFVDKKTSQRLNNQYAKNDYPTDVLSFPYPADTYKEPADNAAIVGGEIVICTPIAQIQAKQYSTNLASEVALLLVHGLLHISGLDHQTASQKASFTGVQDGIMKKLNLKSRTLW